jgi:hypothetical protein
MIFVERKLQVTFFGIGILGTFNKNIKVLVKTNIKELLVAP